MKMLKEDAEQRETLGFQLNTQNVDLFEYVFSEETSCNHNLDYTKSSKIGCNMFLKTRI